MNANKSEIKDNMIKKRWTVLDVDTETIKKVKKYAKKNRSSTGKALDIIVEKFKEDSKEELNNNEVKG